MAGERIDDSPADEVELPWWVLQIEERIERAYKGIVLPPWAQDTLRLCREVRELSAIIADLHAQRDDVYTLWYVHERGPGSACDDILYPSLAEARREAARLVQQSVEDAAANNAAHPPGDGEAGCEPSCVAVYRRKPGVGGSVRVVLMDGQGEFTLCEQCDGQGVYYKPSIRGCQHCQGTGRVRA